MWRAYRWPSLAARLRPGPAGVSPPGVRLGSESLFGFGRNGCSASLGIGVRLQSECPLGFRRNLHREADAITAAIFRAEGEAGLAHLYLTDRRTFDRRMERGRQHFLGPPSGAHAAYLRSKGIIE